jgi:GntR family transcriptional regulator
MIVNRQSPLPLYLQLAEMLKEKIRSREFAPGTRIPSEPSLVRTCGLGRPTVRQAIGVLVREGSLVRRRGSGTFVRETPADIDLFSLAGTTSAFSEKGVALVQKMLKKICLLEIPTGTAHLFSGRRAYFFSRLSFSGPDPVLLEETWLDPEIFSGIENYDFAKLSLSRIVKERFYLTPSSCRQTFRADFDRVRGALLKAGRTAPLLIAERTINFPDHADGIFSLLCCRTDRFSFSQTLTGGVHDA